MRPILQWTADELFALAEKLEVQGLFAAIDIQESADKKGEKDAIARNGAKIAVLNDVVADAIRFVAETRLEADKAVADIKAALGVNDTK